MKLVRRTRRKIFWRREKLLWMVQQKEQGLGNKGTFTIYKRSMRAWKLKSWIEQLTSISNTFLTFYSSGFVILFSSKGRLWMYLQTLWPLNGSGEPMNWSSQYTFALWKEQHFIFARVVIQMEILQIQKVGTQSTFFMILVFFFILYFWRFWNISSEYFRSRRALVKGIWSRAKIIILLSWNFGSKKRQSLGQHWWWFCCWPKFCDFGGSVDTILLSQSVWHLQWTDIGVFGGIGENIWGQYFFEILRLLIFILQADKNDQHRWDAG